MIVFDPTEHSAARCQGMLSQLIVPRPIAMITTLGEAGTVNVAPYSYFMPITGDPMLVAITMGCHREADGSPKDTLTNVTRSGELVINVTTDRIRDHIETAAMEMPTEVSELDVTGWTTIPSQKVATPSLAESPAHLECTLVDKMALGGKAHVFSAVELVIAEVVCVTLDEEICTDDYRIDGAGLAPVGRLGFPHFSTTSAPGATFSLDRIPWAAHTATERA
ncbi:MAG: flavin reductase family protein [Actinomycetota bacterium]|nr:flavin reductase family protein [Actinomycetota bacterium]